MENITMPSAAVPVAPIDPKAKKAKVGFILGLVSIVAWLIPLIGLPVTICGIIFSALGLGSAQRKKAITGLVLSIVFLIASLGNAVAGAVLSGIKEYDRQIQGGTIGTEPSVPENVQE